MITEAVLDFLHGLAVGLATFLHDSLPAAPAFIADLADAFATAVGYIPGAVLWFVPIGPTIAAGVAVFALVVTLGLLRLARRVLSLFTGGGGNA